MSPGSAPVPLISSLSLALVHFSALRPNASTSFVHSFLVCLPLPSSFSNGLPPLLYFPSSCLVSLNSLFTLHFPESAFSSGCFFPLSRHLSLVHLLNICSDLPPAPCLPSLFPTQLSAARHRLSICSGHISHRPLVNILCISVIDACLRWG